MIRTTLCSVLLHEGNREATMMDVAEAEEDVHGARTVPQAGTT